jgi:hypothetical protein
MFLYISPKKVCPLSLLSHERGLGEFSLRQNAPLPPSGSESISEDGNFDERQLRLKER